VWWNDIMETGFFGGKISGEIFECRFCAFFSD